MSEISTDFTATAEGDELEVSGPRYVDIGFSGDMVGTFQLQKKRPADADWRVVEEYTENVEDVLFLAAGPWHVRWEVTAYTSGTGVGALGWVE